MIAEYSAIGSSLGSRYIHAISGLQAATTTATANPIPLLSQKRLLTWLRVILLLCVVASPRPKSISNGAKLVRTVTIATKPKSSGAKSRAKTTAATNLENPVTVLHCDRDEATAQSQTPQVLQFLVVLEISFHTFDPINHPRSAITQRSNTARAEQFRRPI